VTRFRSNHTYANVMVTILAFIVLGGGAYAVSRLPANSVGTKQIKRSAVVSSKVKNGSLRRRDFASGQIPAGARGPTGPAGSGAPAEAATEVAPNPTDTADPCDEAQTAIFCGTLYTGAGTEGNWVNVGGDIAPVAFYKDNDGVVHLSGEAGMQQCNCTTARIFILPGAYRPAATHRFTTSCWQASQDPNDYDNCLVLVNSLGEVTWAGGHFPAAPAGGVSFDGISFRVPVS
jgi:hypothetical protein